MADDVAEDLRASTRFLKRFHTNVEIEEIAKIAFASVQAGTTITEITLEGGRTVSVPNGRPQTLVNACMDILDAADAGENAVASRVVHQDFSANYVQT